MSQTQQAAGDKGVGGGPTIRRAIISTSDKTGLATFVGELVSLGVEIYSTGGTRSFLEQAGCPVVDVAAYTGFPEILDGRVKTLHPKIHAGILCRHDRADDLATLASHGAVTFELVVVNLYPFVETIRRDHVTFDEAIEQIDVGGPALIRAAAKNHAFVTVATSENHYAVILDEIRRLGRTTPGLRSRLAADAFSHTSAYDLAIADFLAGTASETFPPRLTLDLVRKSLLRYGENPHQRAALYSWKAAGGPQASLITARQRHGKELSYNNLLDLDSALGIVRAFGRPAVAVIKHNNPCGAAVADQVADAVLAALDGDAQSAFGGVLAFNVPVDPQSALILTEPGRFIEAIAAPAFDAEALDILVTRPKWRANVRLLESGTFERQPPRLDLRSIAGGVLVQDADVLEDPVEDWQVVTERKPTDAEWTDLRFAWEIVRHVKSNAITVVRNETLVGAGAGQMSRVDAVRHAIEKAGARAQGAALGSDAFFPFADSIHVAAAAGVRSVIQPGGSRQDPAVIAACNQYEMAMVFTGRRHFRH